MHEYGSLNEMLVYIFNCQRAREDDHFQLSGMKPQKSAFRCSHVADNSQ